MTFNDLFTACERHGIDLPSMIGYLVACLLSVWPGNPFVAGVHKWQIKRLLDGDKKKSVEDTEKEYNHILGRFDMRFAALIGVTERFLYIYAVMFAQFSLLSGWLVMKAFFSWVMQEREAAPTAKKSGPPTDRDTLPFYHTYLFGNFLSLLVGLFLGNLGRIVAHNVGLLR